MSAPVVAPVGTTHPLAFAGLVFAALVLLLMVLALWP